MFKKSNTSYNKELGLTPLLLSIYIENEWKIQTDWTESQKQLLINTIKPWYIKRKKIYNDLKQEAELKLLETEWIINGEKIEGTTYNDICFYIDTIIRDKKAINTKEDKIINLQNKIDSIQNDILLYKNNIQEHEEKQSLLSGKREIKIIDNPNINKFYYGIYPSSNDFSSLIFYKHPRGKYFTAAYAVKFDKLPDVGNFNLIYEIDGVYKYWTGTEYNLIVPDAVYTADDSEHQYYATDWRTKLYLDGLRGVINGTDKGYYYEELAAFWPLVYDLKNQCFYGEKNSDVTQYKTLTIGTYYLDFLDSLSTSFGEWSVNNIGRRSDIIVIIRHRGLNSSNNSQCYCFTNVKWYFHSRQLKCTRTRKIYFRVNKRS